MDLSGFSVEVAAAGVAAYLLTALFKRRTWPAEVKTALAVAVSAVVALGVEVGTALYAGEVVNLADWRSLFAGAFGVATVIYGLLSARVPGLANLDRVLTNFGVPSSDTDPERPADPGAV
jgi:hypothetical protein